MSVKIIGEIVNSYGLKGQLKVSIKSSTPEKRFKEGAKILLENAVGEKDEYIVESAIEKNSKIYVIKLKGYDDINDIQFLIGKKVYANVRAEKGTYFYDDLIDMNVIDVTGDVVGKVTGITQMPACEYLLINEKIYVPFLLEKFIDRVDSEKKEIHLTELGSEVSKQ